MPETSLFPDDYQTLRAWAAAHALAGILARGRMPYEIAADDLADEAIHAAESLLDRLGLVNPQTVAPPTPLTSGP